ncbi:MarR family winged helix-turn-helix transcriptional regulator [Ornithinibacillus halotolerans]|uniref:MarR family winged helix-turn-helix transcriptional regulator n=1 Tax=Ornithinibacillus halotolerans TaxID=1274357 RepID=UPI0027E51AEA|nr:MarR family winged helix-turn-helix transcriptional regulator [Ornithinibacillus halotolerans]
MKPLEESFQILDLIDSISERHLQLRKLTQTLWNNSSDIYLSNSEWFIISIIVKKEVPISYITNKVDITRQATHKLIKSLESKGIVETFYVAHNKKNKFIRLTPLGEECYRKNEALKATIEQKIAAKIGNDNLDIFKQILKADWGI